MAATARSSKPKTLALTVESTKGTGPVDASAWQTADSGGNVDRVRFLGVLDTSALRPEAVQDERNQEEFQGKDVPLDGLSDGEQDGIGFVLHGTGSETSDTNTVSETKIARLIGHMMGGAGGTIMGKTFAVDGTPSSDTEMTFDSGHGCVVGQIVFFENPADGLLYPAQIASVATNDITLFQAPYAGVDDDDVVHAAITAFIDEAALYDLTDSDQETLSVLYERFGTSWLMHGGAVSMEGITIERGQAPRIDAKLLWAQVKAPGNGGGFSPTWSSTQDGEPGLVIGAKTRLSITDRDTATLASQRCMSAAINPGISKSRFPAITEHADGLEGTAGYTCEPQDLTAEVGVLIDTAWQDTWDTKGKKRIMLYQIAPAGKAWAIIIPNAFLMEHPATAESGANGMMNLNFTATVNDAASTDVGKSRIVIGMG